MQLAPAARIVSAAASRALATARAAPLGLALFVAAPVSGPLAFVPPAHSQPAAPKTSQSDVVDAYNNAVSGLKAVLSQRRAQLAANQPLPNVPGQALYLARNNMISTYKDLTDAF